MLSITPNPGFVLIVAALLILIAPRGFRAATMAGAALLALWLLLEHDFGVASAMEQMGLQVVLLNLDALNRIFGIAMLIALTFIAMFASARRSRSEDAAILLLAGGSVSALFFGDLIGFVAAAALAGLAAAWVVFASPLENASRAGARLMIWHGLEGLLFLVGVALHLPEGAQLSVFTRLDAQSIGGGFIFAALMIRVGAPLAHVWLKDGASHASPAGGAAFSVFTTMLGVYALARLFPGEPMLTPIGAAMMAIGAFYAAGEDDLRRIAAYALTAQTGVCVALIGVGSPLGMAAAEAHAFTLIFAFAAVQMAAGAIVEREGHASLAKLTGIARAMPITCIVFLIGGLAAAGAPGFAVYTTHAVALEATAQWDLRWLWAMVALVSATTFISVAVRPTIVMFRAAAAPPHWRESPFAMQLGAGLAAFFSVSIGLAPRWLYDLMPANLSFQPFAIDRVAAQVEVLGAAGLVYVLLRAVNAAPAEHGVRLLDIDVFYRGPVASAARWAGVLLLRLYGAWQALTARIGRQGSRGFDALMRLCDRPYAARAGGAALQLLTIAAALLIVFFTR
ncbi:MAG: proton-conducting transporter membrane subunit [Hyphomonadaceae bacterium]